VRQVIHTGVLWALTALLFATLGCDSLPGKPDEADRYVQPDKITDFDYLYQKSCAGCHGADGTLGPARPLNDPLYLAVAGESDLVKSITYGQTGTAMPPFAMAEGGPLAKIQVEAIAKGLIKKWGGTPPKGPLPPHTEAESIAAGLLPGNAAEGRIVYQQFCAGCHGPGGTGGKQAGSIVDGSFLALVSNQSLRTTIIAGRTDLGMPNYREHQTASGIVPMTPQQISDVVAWLAAQRHQFPGQTYPEAPMKKASAASKEKS
jgi:mono/diheme cytochrome c family protein